LLVQDRAASADNWPNRPVTLLIPTAAGGASDGLVRVMTPRLGELLGQTVVVENQGGAGGMIGAARVAKATPDGYLFVLGTSGTHATNQSIYAKPLYDAATDFTPVGLIFEVPQVLLVKKDLPVNNLQEFIAYAKTNEKSLQFGSSGPGGSGHVGCALLNARIGIDVTHVPYRGGAPAITDMISGQVSMMFGNMPELLPQVEARKLRAVAFGSSDRAPALPDVPTIAETVPGFSVSNWFGLIVPARTSPQIVARLNTEAQKALDAPDVRERLKMMGFQILGGKPEKFAATITADTAKWSEVVKASGARID
jgi:tripartite-type tricarboxylate transporter receptor subunit TctC